MRYSQTVRMLCLMIRHSSNLLRRCYALAFGDSLPMPAFAVVSQPGTTLPFLSPTVVPLPWCFAIFTDFSL